MKRRAVEKLNLKQRKFVAAYVEEPNATSAALKAGYSKRTAPSQGSRLLKHADILDAIEDGLSALANRTQVTVDKVVMRLWAEANRTGEGSSHGARVTALRTLAEHLGMLVRRHEHSGIGGKPIPVEHHAATVHRMADNPEMRERLLEAAESIATQVSTERSEADESADTP